MNCFKCHFSLLYNYVLNIRSTCITLQTDGRDVTNQYLINVLVQN